MAAIRVADCIACGGEFRSPATPGRARVYCSDACRKKGGARTLERESSCLLCGKVFMERRAVMNGNRQRYCSSTCRSKADWLFEKDPDFVLRSRRCRWCGGGIGDRGSHRNWCSSSCREKDRKLVQYGLKRADYEKMVVSQNGLCALCGRPFGDETPVIDHCHRNGHVRGLLHNKCNSALGFLDDDADKAFAAALYLTRDQFDLRDLCVSAVSAASA